MSRSAISSASALLVAFTLAACARSAPVPDAAANTSQRSGPLIIASKDLPECALKSVKPRGAGSGIDLDGRPLKNLDNSRVVSVAMSAAESVAALGFASQLVGRDLASSGHGLDGIPVVTDVHSVNAEKVLAVRPTLVLADGQSTPATALKQIAAAGIPIVKLPSAWQVADIGPRLRAIANVFARGNRASELVNQCSISLAPQQTSRPRVAFLYLRGNAGIYLVGGRGSGADSLIQSAGGVDVGASAGFKAFTPITPEAMASLKPDILLVMTKGLSSVGGIKGLRQVAGVGSTPAAKNGAVIAVEDSVLLSFGPRTWSFISELRKSFNSESR